ncbi:phage/plasmid replication protein, II/X family [Aeromonas media]|uniref:phage/plasmid replication protein, II/X family n=1 Tax=Aeromonas media TaxID=651 RepID=UPI003D05C60D
MYDFWEIHIPFSDRWCTTQRIGAGSADIVGMVDLEECGRRGLTLGSRRVDFAIDREGTIHDLYHPWESLPSSFTDLAVKLHQAHLKRSWPCIALKASPAKLLQGHNVYGPDNAAAGILELLAAFARALPRVAEMLDWGNAHIRRVDVTNSIQLPDAETLANCLSAIGNLSHRHLRAAKESDYESTIYFNKRSQDQQDAGRTKVLVVYAKHNEMQHQLEQLKRAKRTEKTSRYDSVIQNLESPELNAFAANRLRFEGRALTRWFERNKIPRNVWQFLTFVGQFESNPDNQGMTFCEWAWRDLFSDMFQALGATKVSLTQNSRVQEQLRKHYGRCKVINNPDGSTTEKWSYARADRLMLFYRSLATDGWDKTKRLTASSTFYDAVNCLMTIGLTKAQLQNLKKRQTLKLLHLIKVDFSAQRPANYVEPVGTVLDKQGDILSIGDKFGRGFVQSFGQSREQLIARAVGSYVDLAAAEASVQHLIAGRPLRISEGFDLHLAVFDDGSFELVRGDIFQYHDKYEIPVPDQPKYGSDEELMDDFAAYLGTTSAPEFDARSYADTEHRKLSIILDSLRGQLADAEQDPDMIAKAIQLRERISHTKARLDRLWYWAHKATDSRGRNIKQGEIQCQV